MAPSLMSDLSVEDVVVDTSGLLERRSSANTLHELCCWAQPADTGGMSFHIGMDRNPTEESGDDARASNESEYLQSVSESYGYSHQSNAHQVVGDFIDLHPESSYERTRHPNAGPNPPNNNNRRLFAEEFGILTREDVVRDDGFMFSDLAYSQHDMYYPEPDQEPVSLSGVSRFTGFAEGAVNLECGTSNVQGHSAPPYDGQLREAAGGDADIETCPKRISGHGHATGVSEAGEELGAGTRDGMLDFPDDNGHLSLPFTGATTEPESSFGEPNFTHGEASVTVEEPDVTAGEPSVTFGEPDVTAGEPSVTFGEPDVTAGEPDVTVGEPGVTVGEPNTSDAPLTDTQDDHQDESHMPSTSGYSTACTADGADTQVTDLQTTPKQENSQPAQNSMLPLDQDVRHDDLPAGRDVRASGCLNLSMQLSPEQTGQEGTE